MVKGKISTERTEIANLLNECAAKLYSGKVARGDSFTFSMGNAQLKLNQLIADIAPQGKVLLLHSKDSFIEYGKDCSIAVRDAGAKAHNVVVQDGYEFIKAAADVTNAPEDVRVIVACDRKLLELGAYFAKLRGITLVFIQRGLLTDGVLSPHIFIKNGDKLDVFRAEIKRHIIIDENSFTMDKAARAYLDIESKIAALADYRISCSLNGTRAAKDAYSLAREAIISVYGIFQTDRQNMPAQLLYYGFLIELANACSRGKLFDFCALNLAERVLLGGKSGDGLKLRMYSAISGIYYALVCGEYDKITYYPDYLARADVICDSLCVDRGIITDGLKRQTDLLCRHSRKIKIIMERLKSELISQNTAVSAVSSAYYALGGDGGAEESVAAFAVKHCGDLPFGINGISLARERGITEFL